MPQLRQRQNIVGNIKDESSISDRVKIQKNGQLALNGSESGWGNAGGSLTTVYTLSITIAGLFQLNSTLALCSVLGYGSYGIAADSEGVYFNSGGVLIYKILKTKIDGLAGSTTTDKFKTWLNSNNPTVFYQLANSKSIISKNLSQ